MESSVIPTPAPASPHKEYPAITHTAIISAPTHSVSINCLADPLVRITNAIFHESTRATNEGAAQTSMGTTGKNEPSYNRRTSHGDNRTKPDAPIAARGRNTMHSWRIISSTLRGWDD